VELPYLLSAYLSGSWLQAQGLENQATVGQDLIVKTAMMEIEEAMEVVTNIVDLWLWVDNAIPTSRIIFNLKVGNCSFCKVI
jgi:hypothetical protein